MPTPFEHNCRFFQVHFLEDQTPVSLEQEAQRAERMAGFLRALNERPYLHGKEVWTCHTSFGVYHLKAPTLYVEALVEEGLLDPHVLESEPAVESYLRTLALEGAFLTLEGGEDLDSILEELAAYDSILANLNADWVEELLEPYRRPSGGYDFGAET